MLPDQLPVLAQCQAWVEAQFIRRKIDESSFRGQWVGHTYDGSFKLQHGSATYSVTYNPDDGWIIKPKETETKPQD